MKKLFILLLSFYFFTSCQSEKTPISPNSQTKAYKSSLVPVGSPCDENTLCDGACNTALPGGMCIKPCSDTEPCENGQTCTTFLDGDSETSYCVPSCTTNSDCSREGYSCISGICRPKVSFLELCEETEDCKSCDEQTCPEGVIASIGCIEGICTTPCYDQSQCTAGTYCALSPSADPQISYWCVPIDFDESTGKAGSNCALNPCVSGYTCLSSFAEDSFAYCSKTCTTDRDCPPQMTCKDNGAGSKYCYKRTYCQNCFMDSQCGYQGDRCVQNNSMKYCSKTCDPALAATCPSNSTCKEAFFCENLNAWVDNCSQCPSGSCNAGSPSVYQCFNNSACPNY